MSDERATPGDRMLAITTVINTNYGDHGERVRHPHRYVPGETVEDLVARVLPRVANKWGQHDHADSIEILVVPPTKPIPPGEPDPWKAVVAAADEAPF